jgi:hypothetical protein
LGVLFGGWYNNRTQVFLEFLLGAKPVVIAPDTCRDTNYKGKQQNNRRDNQLPALHKAVNDAPKSTRENANNAVERALFESHDRNPHCHRQD